ncbi:thioesterase family protein [Azospirillum sp. B4]|uniref:acyl-CoA thioesterase n=1 Tax=Azospirillum sp. B4 TaxID=95605 RepID=UPI00131EE9DC|nr:thioesterase family protein [Azospirillum sp. B4]
MSTPATNTPATPHPESRADYRHFQPITTRWADNDAYGHVNNVVYYSYFDTAVNQHMIEKGVLAPDKGTAIALVVETQCRYFAPITFPDRVTVGVRVAHMGRSSVRYELALFRNEEDAPAAAGHYVHVYVDNATRRPTPIPEDVAAVLRTMVVKEPA